MQIQNLAIAASAVLIIIIAIFTLVTLRRIRSKGEGLITSGGAVPNSGLSSKLGAIFGRGRIDPLFWSDLEQTLIEADCGVETTEMLIRESRNGKSPDEVKSIIRDKMISLFPKSLAQDEIKPRIILVLGVNGVGKTTTIAKLANIEMKMGRRVLLVAADTFRAAAIEQLKEWARRLKCEIVAQQIGADSASVAFDGVEKGSSRGFDTVLIDTAGRLHTKQNLMDELKKVARVIGKSLPGAPHERVIVIDATVGSNGLAQAREFNSAMGLTGVVVTKLDGTAKGGVVIAIANELKVPITHIGIGERMEDLKAFVASEFVASIIA